MLNRTPIVGSWRALLQQETHTGCSEAGQAKVLMEAHGHQQHVGAVFVGAVPAAALACSLPADALIERKPHSVSSIDTSS